MKNSLTDVRNLMIAQMEKLVNPEEGEEPNIEAANAVANLGKVLIDSAKAEVAYLKLMHKKDESLTGTGFIQKQPVPQIGAGK